jgi:hypothetical protein
MIHAWDTICWRAGDAAFGWTLAYPRDLVVIAFGIGLGLLLYAVRRLTTDRQLLRQIAVDELRLRELIRTAKAEHDRERTLRFQSNWQSVRVRRFQAELTSVCLSLFLLAAMTTWGQSRLGELPWRAGDVVQLSVHAPPSTVGEIIHVVPQTESLHARSAAKEARRNSRDQAGSPGVTGGLSSVNGWIRTIRYDVVRGIPMGTAEWSLRLDSEPVPRAISVRLGARTVEHFLMTQGSLPAKAIQRHDSVLETQIPLRPYRPLGLLPQHILQNLPGWAILLMLSTGMVFFGLRRIETQT